MEFASHAMRLVGGTVGGKYVIQRVLGVGGMGAVYEAHHAYTNRRVALKVLGPDYASSHDAVTRFLQEAQAPSSIGHPNIVEVLDAGEDPQVGLYVVLEFLEGEDLEAAVERGGLDLPALLDVTLQLLDALGAAHARGFVHRDIKPANVFLTRNRDGSLKVKLLDFGIAKNVSRGLTVGNAVMGTPHYMAPEQAQGLAVDARADLWAVGAVLFHALSGVPPYDGDNPNVIMVTIIMNEPPSLAARCPNLSGALLEVVDRALTKDPALRWPDAKSMAARLATVPELRGAARRITSTLRNRGGAVSEMRPSPAPALPFASTMGVTPSGTFGPSQPGAAPTPRTGTLGPDDLPGAPGAPAAALAAAPHTFSARPASLAPPDAPTAPPPAPRPRRRAPLVAAVAAAVAVAVVGAAFALRHDPAPAPTQAPRRAAVTRPEAAPTPAPRPPATAPTPAPTPPPAATAPTPAPPAPAPALANASPDDEPDDDRGRHGRRRRRPRRHGRGHGDGAPTAQPATATATANARPATTRIGGLQIGGY